MTQIDELKPCPFCGNTEIAHDSTVECDYIYCTKCDCGTHAYKRGSGESLKAWNTRAPRTITREELEKAAKELAPYMAECFYHPKWKPEAMKASLATLGITVEGE